MWSHAVWWGPDGGPVKGGRVCVEPCSVVGPRRWACQGGRVCVEPCSVVRCCGGPDGGPVKGGGCVWSLQCSGMLYTDPAGPVGLPGAGGQRKRGRGGIEQARGGGLCVGRTAPHHTRAGVVWCGLVWYGVVWRGVVCSGAACPGVVWCPTWHNSRALFAACPSSFTRGTSCSSCSCSASGPPYPTLPASCGCSCSPGRVRATRARMLSTTAARRSSST